MQGLYTRSVHARLSGQRSMKAKRHKQYRTIKERIEAVPEATKRRWLAWMLAILMIAVLITTEALRCAKSFTVTHYEVSYAALDSKVRIAMLSDLHGSEFGKCNERLIDAVAQIEPDVILCVGDMISQNDTREKLNIGINLIKELTQIAPVYVSMGNHEQTYDIDHPSTDIGRLYAETGAVVLDEEYADITVNGNDIRIGGILDHTWNFEMSHERFAASEEYAFLSDFCDTDSLKILMCHRPSCYFTQGEGAVYEDWDIDLVLAGHTHGGLLRLPGIGSIYLPAEGFFPKYDKGLFDMGNADMIIGGGLGHGGILFRLFNQCELLSIEIGARE